MLSSEICAKIICVDGLYALQSLIHNTSTAITSTKSILLYEWTSLVFCHRCALSESSKLIAKYNNQNIHCIAHKQNDNSQSFVLNGNLIVYYGTYVYVTNVPIRPSARAWSGYLLRVRRHRPPSCARAIQLEVGNPVYFKPAINRLSMSDRHGVCNSILYPKQRGVML